MQEELYGYDVPAFLRKKRQNPQPEETEAQPKKEGRRLASQAKSRQAINTFRLRKSGNSTIITVPDEVLALLEVRIGDYLEFVYLEEEKLLVLQEAEDGVKKKKGR